VRLPPIPIVFRLKRFVLLHRCTFSDCASIDISRPYSPPGRLTEARNPSIVDVDCVNSRLIVNTTPKFNVFLDLPL